MVFEKKTGRYLGQPKDKLDPSINLERQVYFFATFEQTKNTEHWKYVIIDAKTKKLLASGTSNHRYDNPYK